MAKKALREKTKYKNIYFNTKTKKYDPLTQKNTYHAKWKYNLMTLSEAKTELAKMQSGDMPIDESMTVSAGDKM